MSRSLQPAPCTLILAAGELRRFSIEWEGLAFLRPPARHLIGDPTP